MHTFTKNTLSNPLLQPNPMPPNKNIIFCQSLSELLPKKLDSNFLFSLIELALIFQHFQEPWQCLRSKVVENQKMFMLNSNFLFCQLEFTLINWHFANEVGLGRSCRKEKDVCVKIQLLFSILEFASIFWHFAKGLGPHRVLDQKVAQNQMIAFWQALSELCIAK